MSSGWTTLDSFAGFVMRSSAAHAWSVCTKIDYPRCRWQASARDDERAWTLTGRGRSPIDRVARAPSRLAPLRGGTGLIDARTLPMNSFSAGPELIHLTTTTRSLWPSTYTMFWPAPRNVKLDSGAAGSDFRPVFKNQFA